MAQELDHLTESISPLYWMQYRPLGPERELVLQSESKTYARLFWKKYIGSLATATTVDSAWTFKRGGFFRPVVTIRVLDSDQDIAIFDPTGWGFAGTLEFKTGARIRWMNKDFLHSQWAFLNEAKQDIVIFEPLLDKIPLICKVQVCQNIPELPILVCLGMYILTLMNEDSFAARGVPK